MCLAGCAVPLEWLASALTRFSSMYFFVMLKRPLWKYIDGLTTLFYSFFLNVEGRSLFFHGDRVRMRAASLLVNNKEEESCSSLSLFSFSFFFVHSSPSRNHTTFIDQPNPSQSFSGTKTASNTGPRTVHRPNKTTGKQHLSACPLLHKVHSFPSQQTDITSLLHHPFLRHQQWHSHTIQDSSRPTL